MEAHPKNAIAVVFVSQRNGADRDGYDRAAGEMEAEAARQPGYLGMDSVHDAEGRGITVSYWRDEAAAMAWRDHAGHAAVRERGRADWYDSYRVVVGRISRSYIWHR